MTSIYTDPRCAWEQPGKSELLNANGKPRCQAAKLDRQNDADKCFYRQCFKDSVQGREFCAAHLRQANPVLWSSLQAPPTATTVPGGTVPRNVDPIDQVINYTNSQRRDSEKLAASAQTMIDTLQRIREEYVSTQNSLADVNARLVELGRTSAEDLDRRLSEAKTEGEVRYLRDLAQREAALTELKGEKQQLDVNLEANRGELLNAKKDLDLQRAEVAATQKRLQALEQDLLSVRAQYQDADLKVGGLNEAKSVIERSLEEKERIITEQAQELKSLRESGNTTSSELKAARLDLERSNVELTQLRTENQRLGTELQAAQTQLVALQNRITEIEQSLASANQLTLTLTQQTNSTETNLAQLTQERDALRKDLLDIQREREILNAEIGRLNQENKTLSDRLQTSDAEIVRLNALSSELETKVSQLQAAQEALENAQTALEILGLVDGSSNNYRTETKIQEALVTPSSTPLPPPTIRPTSLPPTIPPTVRPVPTSVPPPIVENKINTLNQEVLESKSKGNDWKQKFNEIIPLVNKYRANRSSISPQTIMQKVKEQGWGRKNMDNLLGLSIIPLASRAQVDVQQNANNFFNQLLGKTGKDPLPLLV